MLGIAQRCGEQAQRVQRLAQIVAGRGEELRLGEIRPLGFLLCGFRELPPLAQCFDQIEISVADRDRLADQGRLAAAECQQHQQVERPGESEQAVFHPALHDQLE